MKKTPYESFMIEIEKKYGICPKCGKQREHLKEIHTFRCKCGEDEWYVERVGDKEAGG